MPALKAKAKMALAAIWGEKVATELAQRFDACSNI